MASSSGTSGDSPAVERWGAEAEQRKRKRMQSNRESARRSRMRKQKHLDDLTAQAAQLRKENAEILSGVNATTHRFVSMEADNSILRAQMMELTHRLASLNQILTYINSVSAAASFGGGGGSCMFESEEFQQQGFGGDGFSNGGSWNSMGLSHHPIMADMFDY